MGYVCLIERMGMGGMQSGRGSLAWSMWLEDLWNEMR